LIPRSPPEAVTHKAAPVERRGLIPGPSCGNWQQFAKGETSLLRVSVSGLCRPCLDRPPVIRMIQLAEEPGRDWRGCGQDDRRIDAHHPSDNRSFLRRQEALAAQEGKCAWRIQPESLSKASRIDRPQKID
jgi:hypothetical protein